MSLSVVTHDLSLVVRFRDHFTGAAIREELPVRLDNTFERPVVRNGGTGRRQEDGSYRFLSLPPGLARLLWRDPFTRGQAGWVRFDEIAPLPLPRPNPSEPIEIELWRDAGAIAPAGATGVRGKLIGANAADLVVRIAPSADPFDRFTQSDAQGEFLFLPPGRLPTATIASNDVRVRMKIDVHTRDGVSRPITSGSFRPGGILPDFPRRQFRNPTATGVADPVPAGLTDTP